MVTIKAKMLSKQVCCQHQYIYFLSHKIVNNYNKSGWDAGSILHRPLRYWQFGLVEGTLIKTLVASEPSTYKVEAPPPNTFIGLWGVTVFIG